LNPEPSDLAKAHETIPSGHTVTGTAAPDDEEAPIAETYELINSPPWRYLCSIPVIAPPPVKNRTATELAKAEEARELSRASARGWELMSGLNGHCMYFVSGWWSYSFCYGKQVVQFHAAPGRPGEPPVKDENSLEYVLGRVPELPATREPAGQDEEDGDTKSLAPPNVQLQTKGDQRYLSQRLGDGTICDLTGRPRTIEIQYHCSPGATTDRIGWVKEVTTCAYLMAVYTPRLCRDVAFHPPKEIRAHPVRCRRILGSEDDERTWRYEKMAAAAELLSQKPRTREPGREIRQNHFAGVTIGGVVVGGKKHVSDELAEKLLPLPRGVTRGQANQGQQGQGQADAKAQQQQYPVVETLVHKKKDAADVERLSDEELKRLKLDPKAVAQFSEVMERRAGNRGWKLQVVEVAPGEYEYVGAFDDDEEDGMPKTAARGAATGEGAGATAGPGASEPKKQQVSEGSEQKEEQQPRAKGEEKAGKEEEEHGSKEKFFKDEL
jgi:protein OS-9